MKAKLFLILPAVLLAVGCSKEFPTEKLTTGPIVDLGLSVKWCSFNIGADDQHPYDVGGYYQWAGKSDVTNEEIFVSSSNCPYHSGSEPELGWLKYVPKDTPSRWGGSGEPDNILFIERCDDIAYETFGGNFRIPTQAEWEELRQGCKWKMTTVSGVPGCLVKSNVRGYKDKCIFLPLAGYRFEKHLSEESKGYYWSSSLDTQFPERGVAIQFDASNGGEAHVDTNYHMRRANGLNIRAVCD